MDITKIFFIIALFSLFFGIVTTLAFDIIYIIANPVEGSKKLAYDIATTVINSQNELSKSIVNLLKAKSKEEVVYYLSRMIASSLITIFLIWLFYKILRFFFEAPRPIEKITLILVSMLLVYVITQVSAGLLNLKTEPIPYYGFVKLITHSQEIAQKIMSVYK